MKRRSFMKMTVAGATLAALGACAEFSSEPDIVDTAVAAGSFTTLVAAVQAAGLVDALQGEGPFTVFAPTNDAFAKLPEGTVESLLEPAAKDTLVKILTAHVVADNLSGTDLARLAAANGGRYNMVALSGDALTAEMVGSKLYIYDESGGAAEVTIGDVRQSNGVIHVINDVLLPK